VCSLFQLLKEMFTQVFGSPKGHPHVKPFVDHVLSLFVVDGRIWFRNYQIVFSGEKEGEGKKGKGDTMLVEIGPRFVLNPVRIFSGSFGGPTLWQSPNYVSPNLVRSQLQTRKSAKYAERINSREERADHTESNTIAEDEIETVFQ
jgi:ribosome biogenesis protein BRX1